MAQHPTPETLIDPEVVARDLDELDRLIHRLRSRVGRLIPLATRSGSYSALRAMAGILKGKLTEDPVTYQRRIREESDARRVTS